MGHRFTRQSAGALFAAFAAFLLTRDITFDYFRHALPDWAYTASGLTGIAASIVAYPLAARWLRRLP
ncbi:hypothetical protein ACIQPR_16420 [Streptomyces sp. NPDC091280]|uniref:hypothetical protein n=1 Tax=Streptomyces sp. NPDC091280 TaxID=3365984 RepID=UPI0037F58C84